MYDMRKIPIPFPRHDDETPNGNPTSKSTPTFTIGARRYHLNVATMCAELESTSAEVIPINSARLRKGKPDAN